MLLVVLLAGLLSVSVRAGAPTQHLKLLVITHRRTQSLKRLLGSAAAASRSLGQRVDLHVSVDHSPPPPMVHCLGDYEWPYGTFKYTVARARRGLAGQWLECWDDADRPQRFVILEDDLELSVYALEWLVDAEERYADRPVAGFSLQRQTNCFDGVLCSSPTLELPWSVTEYAYRLVGTWGFAPKAWLWASFLEWREQTLRYNSSFVPYKANYQPSAWYAEAVASGRADSMWSMWFIAYCDLGSSDAPVIYYNHPTRQTLSSHRMEAGEHFSGGDPDARDFPVLSSRPVESIVPVQQLVSLDWDGAVPNSLAETAELAAIQTAFQILTGNELTPLLTFVNSGFRRMTEHFLCNMQEAAPHRIRQLTVVCMDATMYAWASDLSRYWGFRALPFGGSLRGSKGHLVYGTLDYFRLIMQRTTLIRTLLEGGHRFLLLEFDAYVAGDFVDAFESKQAETGVDVVGVSDVYRGDSGVVNGGFMLLMPSASNLLCWTEVERFFGREIRAAEQDNKSGSSMVWVRTEQDLFSDFLRQKRHGIQFEYLARNKYVSGQVFELTGSTRLQELRPEIVLFNWASGNAAKRARAISAGLWHTFDQYGRCTADIRPCAITQYDTWHLCRAPLDSAIAPVVVSFGVGGDIGFEADVVERHPSARVMCFDPTVTEKQFRALEEQAGLPLHRLEFYPIGVGAADEQVAFYKSKDPRIQSLSSVAVPGYELFAELPVRTLEHLMDEFRIELVDVLKMDIGGSEFAVVRNWQDSPVPVRQVALGLHSRFMDRSSRPKIYDSDSVFSVMISARFALQHVSENEEELLFVKYQ